MYKYLFVFLLNFFALAAGAADPTQTLIEQLDQIKAQHNVGAYALVISDDKQQLLLHTRLSKAHTPAQGPAAFRIGSITKNFVALGIYRAQQQGLLKVTDPVHKYLPATWLNNTYNKNVPITIAHLLEHSAGLPDMSRAEFAEHQPYSLKDALEKYASQHQVLWPPGQLHSYSNTGYGYLGHILEVATKMPLEQWLKTQVFAPLAMPSASTLYSDELARHLVPGFEADGVTPIPYWHMLYTSLGAINLYPQDMAHLIQFYLTPEPRFLSLSVREYLLTPHTTLAAKHGLDYGYASGLYSWYHKGVRFYGHGGDADGYLSRLGFSQDLNLGYFLVINSFNHAAKAEMEQAIENFLTRDYKRDGIELFDSRTDLSKFAGDYAVRGHRFAVATSTEIRMRLKWQRQQLWIQQNEGRWYPLQHVGDLQFKRPFEPDASSIIVEHYGEIWFQGDEGNFVRQQ